MESVSDAYDPVSVGRKIVDQLVKLLLGNHFGDNMMSDVRATLEHCARAGPAWPIKIFEAGEYIDRAADMLGGPNFTSAAHPWPSDGQKLLEPVMQLDLELLGNLRKLDLGRGLLQLWASADRIVTRVLPLEALKHEAAAIPSLKPEDFVCRMTPRTGSNRPSWLTHACQIVGFKNPVFDCGIDELVGHIESILENLWPEDVRLAEELKLLREKLGVAVAGTSMHRAYGMGNEYADFPAAQLPQVLFVLDEVFPLRESMNADDCVYLCKGGSPNRFSVYGRNLSTSLTDEGVI